MVKEIKSVTVQIEVTKNEAGEVDVVETAHIEVGASEYPELSHRKGILVTLASAQKTTIINHVKNVVLPQAEAAK